MFLRATKRIKDGKEHRYFSVVENVRHPGAKHPVQKPILYLGELNDTQQAAWSKALLVFDAATQQTQPLRLFPEDRTPPPDPIPAVQVRWQQYELRHPRHYRRLLAGLRTVAAVGPGHLLDRETRAAPAKAPTGPRPCSSPSPTG